MSEAQGVHDQQPDTPVPTLSDFLRFAIGHLEARIALVDNKAVLLITIANAIAVGVAWASHSLVTKDTTAWLRLTAGVLGVFTLVAAAVATLLILGAIRPTKHILGRDVKPRRLDTSHGALLWPPRVPPVPPAPPKRTLRERAAFLTKALWEWVKRYVSTLFHRKRDLPRYPEGQTGCYEMPDKVSIALASDWGAGTPSAYAVGEQIRRLYCSLHHSSRQPR